MNLQVIDKDAKTWFVNLAAFRLPDADTGHIFEPGVKYQIHESEWMKGQPMIKATTIDEEVQPLEPHQTGNRIDAAAEGDAPKAEAPKTAGKK